MTATFIVAVASKLVSAVVMPEGIGVPRDHHSGDHRDVRDGRKAEQQPRKQAAEKVTEAPIDAERVESLLLQLTRR